MLFHDLSSQHNTRFQKLNGLQKLISIKSPFPVPNPQSPIPNPQSPVPNP
ncbi:hypothetical protein FDUTEX481_00235 [Tolypothrix sp. PCC 7601]|nr:hypothetical protein FDUTEX481_00235 [Tolypothrix sp. PCC 7601]